MKFGNLIKIKCNTFSFKKMGCFHDKWDMFLTQALAWAKII